MYIIFISQFNKQYINGIHEQDILAWKTSKMVSEEEEIVIKEHVNVIFIGHVGKSDFSYRALAQRAISSNILHYP